MTACGPQSSNGMVTQTLVASASQALEISSATVAVALSRRAGTA